MKTFTLNTAWQRSSPWARSLAWVSLAAGVWALSAGTAHAQGGNEVHWSIGVNQPGVSVGVSNTPPVVVVQPRPQVVVVERPVVVYGDRGYRQFDNGRGHKPKKPHKHHDRHGDHWKD